MQEFSSVTASSYDADSLTPLLNEKAADGWNVISIVSAGTNIVAYLSREAGELDTLGQAAFAAQVEGAAGDDFAAESALFEAGDDVAPDVFSDGTSVDDAIVAEAAVADAAIAVDEPAGWAAAPQDTSAPTDDSLAGLATTQVDETLANIDALLAAAHARQPGLSPRMDATTRLKVYVRDAGDLPVVAAHLDARLGPVPRLVLHAAICRRELRVEIDGVHG